MLGVLLIVIGNWALAWGIHTLFISKIKKRVALGSIIAPAGLFLFYSGLYNLLM